MNINQICAQFRISKQAHYQKIHREKQKETEQERITSMVREIRITHPRLGTRKLLKKIEPNLEQKELKMGRDRLFDLLRSKKMLISPRKSRKITTTSGFFRTPNLLPGKIISQPNQVWVADITYIDVEVERFVFLFLLMDLYSRFIVGWHVTPSLESEGAIQSLTMALKFQNNTETSLIHHSDHGVQYTSRAYMCLLMDHKVRASMGEIGNCYDNIYAERVIGTLKNEYLLGDRFVDLRQVQTATRQAVFAYNTDRPHLSLNYGIPIEVYSNSNITISPVLIPEKVS
jgi:transposase InsO family protein